METKDAPDLSPSKFSHSNLAMRDDGQSGSLPVLCQELVDKLKLRFGALSEESIKIHNILGEFKAGEVTKRDAHAAILETLGDHEDLKQNLRSILDHKDADWGDGDFDRQDKTLPPAQPSPEFLQPPHLPQLPMPVMSAPWYSGQPLQPSPPENQYGTDSPRGWSDYGQTNFGRQASSPIPYYHAQFQGQHTSPQAHLALNLLPYEGNKYDVNFNSFGPSYEALHSDSFNETWEETALERAWVDTEPYSQHPMHVSTENQRISPLNNTSKGFESHASLPNTSFSTRSSSISEAPFAMSSTQSANVVPRLPPPPPPLPQIFRKRSHNELASSTDPHSHRGDEVEENLETHNPPTPSSVPVLVTDGSKPSQERPFVHGLCGKSFPSRSAVKKHHWGARNDDLATTTGCWAKHGKPNVQWNEHPSCIQQVKSRPTARNQVFANAEGIEPSKAGMRAPRVPTTGQSSFSVFPTLSGLPGLVAQTLRNTAAPMHYAREAASTDQPPLASPRGSLDALFTAVNIVSKIDAPKPQGRNDSLVTNLDTKAAASEHDGRPPTMMSQELRNGPTLYSTAATGPEEYTAKRNGSDVSSALKRDASGTPEPEVKKQKVSTQKGL